MGKCDIAINLIKRCAGLMKPSCKTNFVQAEKTLNIKGLTYCPIKGDCFQSSLPKTLKGASNDVLDSIKPSQFKNILNSRSDISAQIIESIDTVDKLALYDDLMPILKQKNMSDREINNFFKNVFEDCQKSNSLADVRAKREVLSDLLAQGYDVNMLSRIPITHFNKNQIKYILDQAETLHKLSQDSCGIKLFKLKNIPEIVRYVDDNNIKYLSECLELTQNPQNLIFWNSDSSKIIKELCQDPKHSTYILEIIFRRKLSYNDVLKVADGGKISGRNSDLLEFYNFDKLKDIGLDDLDKLSTEEKKYLLDGFVSVIRPGDTNASRMSYLASRMKIFRELNTSSAENFKNDYYKIIRSILNSIPESERIMLTKTKSMYKDMYMVNNPIPAMVDDITKLPYSEELINGRKIKVVELSKDTDKNLAIHQTCEQSGILNLEAMEITNPDEFICTGLRKCQGFDGIDDIREFMQNGNKAEGLHFGKGAFGIAVRPRDGGDTFIQAGCDIWSDGFTKTPYNMIRGTQAHLNERACSYIPELIKKELNLSQKEYTLRMQKIAKATTLDEIEKLDPELAVAIRKVSKDYPMFEGIIRPKIMGICVDANSKVSDDVLDYCARHDDVRLVKILGY